MSETAQTRTPLLQALDEIVGTLRSFIRSPRAMWGVNVPYFLEGIAYFGVLTLLMKYLSENVALGDITAGVVVSFFTGGITFAMFFLGEMGDRFGLRRVLLASILLMGVGRIFITFAGYLPGGSLFSPAFLMTATSLLIVVIGFGMFQPVLFSAVKQFSTRETSAMAFAVVYGLNNLGAFVAGLLSPKVRGIASSAFPPNGINGVFALYTVLTLASVAITGAILTRATVRAALAARPETAAREEAARGENRPRVFSCRWFAEHPLRDPRFAYFIFILIPVQTLFAHNWLTLPLYINRAFVPWVADRFELFSNLGPLLVFLLAPLVAALTAKRDPLDMMVWGTLVMAAPTFLLVLGPSPAALITFIVLMTVGESMWQPRFYHYLTELAPPGKTGAYVGIGQLPWFLTKFLTGMYAGWFLQRFCPAEGVRHSEQMWLIYALIAMVSPVALLLTRSWLRGGTARS
ncbi:MAG: MFS transporter [Thermoanaerobaculaceae bacterium]|nr:MFS transporter [Thermoanaerobaculaceae bacterium]MDI9621002.1 MFS transporter [Acidobacteriota bacterium]NLH12685.1 MFS transporter [Holophagae bacterium]HPW56676.1 MFS transporter [Thermoanaerobaculaceae bacterium]